MVEHSSAQGAEHWKQKYYDQLDQLEQKEIEWEKLETILKKAIGRLSLAAEGYHSSVDRHIKDIKLAIKQNVNRQRLDIILDELSQVLLKIDEKAIQPDQQLIHLLHELLTKLNFSGKTNKAKNKLINTLSKATDQDAKKLLQDVIKFIQAEIPESAEQEDGGGLFSRLLGKNNTAAETDKLDIQFASGMLQQLVQASPWPEIILDKKTALLKQIGNIKTEAELNQSIEQLLEIYRHWPETESHIQDSSQAIDPDQRLESYRQCFLSLLNQLDNLDSPDGRLAAFRVNIINANEYQELNELSASLAKLISESHVENNEELEENRPSIQELLQRLLEQLIVPLDLQADVEAMRHRLQQESSPDDWKKLLKDVASLINSIRSRLQEEKTDFEEFLQQVTSRLKEMDSFLQIENSTLQTAEQEGKDFDSKVETHVRDIRDDINQASELGALKITVEQRLDTISAHIKEYRSVEQQRYSTAQENIKDMQQRMANLEGETVNLKKIIVEKNKLALYDALTGIPNRLFYEQKAKEEIARWKRFANPLSLAVWDIDFFKKVNDQYGHKAGDKVLKTVAQLLSKRIRQTDFFARYGGEEFVMLLPGTKVEETIRLVNELREQVANCGFHFSGEAVPITLSCGVSSFQDKDTLSAVFERADQALYRAKENGRNQCVVDSCLT